MTTGKNRIAIISSSATALVIFRGPLIEEMCKRGFTVGAFAPDFTDDLKVAVARCGAQPIDYRLERTGRSVGNDLISVVDLSRLLLRYRPDIVLSHFMKPVIYGTIAATLAKVPHRYAMIEGLGFAFTETGERSWSKRGLKSLMQMLLRVALRCAERVVFLNEDDRLELVRAGIAAADRSVVLGGIGLRLIDFPFVETSGEGPPIFLMIGRLLKEKGVFEFVEAARTVRTFHPNARFILVGGADPKPGSPTTQQLRSWIDEGLIEWPGMVEDVRPYLRQSTTFVLPSYREGLPRSTQEAMAIGRAVITTDVPGCRATVDHGLNGLLVPPRDPAALAEAMIRLAADRPLAIAMGRRSRQMAEAQFDVDKVNDRLLGFITPPEPASFFESVKH